MNKALRSETDRDELPIAESPSGLVAPAFAEQDSFSRDVWSILGVPFDNVDIDGAVAKIDEAVRTRRKLSFVTPNVNWLVRALNDTKARAQILNADLSLADGAPIGILARLLGAAPQSRVAGSDLFEALRRRPAFSGRTIKVFFFGGNGDAGERARAALENDQGGLECVGVLNPGYGDVDAMSAPAIIKEINDAEPDFIVVALGAAKGQAWIDRNNARLRAPVIAHLGAVINFTGGTVERAPRAYQTFGLEWLWRIRQEPALWRRYFRDGVALARILVTRAVPLALRRARKKAPHSGDARICATPFGADIKLVGDLTIECREVVRTAFRQAAKAGGEITLDLHHAYAIDAAILGQILMLEQTLNEQGRVLRVKGCKAMHSQILAANAMRYSSPTAAAPTASLAAAG